MVPCTALEERIFGAIRERILVPEAVADAVEQVLERVAHGLREKAGAPSVAARARLVELEEELATLRRLGGRVVATLRPGLLNATASVVG